MPKPVLSLRCDDALLRAIDAKAGKIGISRSEWALDVLAEAALGLSQEELPKPKPKPKAPPKAVAHPAPADKPAVARAALAQAEARVGAPVARLNTSMVPVFAGGKRPAYQRAKARS